MTPQDLVQLSLLLDGELSTVEAAGLRARLQDEPELRKAYERLQRLSTVVLLPTAADAKAATEAMASMGLVQPPAAKWPWLLGALVVALVVGSFVSRQVVVEPGLTPPAAPKPVATQPAMPVQAVVVAPPIQLPPDAGTVVLSVPKEGEWITVRGVGPIDFAGAHLSMSGEAVLMLDRNGSGRLDAPRGTRSTAFFETPDGATIVAFVLSGDVTFVPPPAPDAGRKPRFLRLLVGERRVLKGFKGATFRVEDASVLSARVVNEDVVELRGLKEGTTELVVNGRYVLGQGRYEVSTRSESGVPTIPLLIGDSHGRAFPGLVRWSAGDRTIARVEGLATNLTFTGLRPGSTTLQLWFDDGRREDWAIVVARALELPFAAQRFVPLWMDRRVLLTQLPVSAQVTVEPKELAEVISIGPGSVALSALTRGKGRVVVTDPSGARQELLLQVD